MHEPSIRPPNSNLDRLLFDLHQPSKTAHTENKKPSERSATVCDMANPNSSSLPLPLRPWPRPKPGHDQLQFTIGRMQLEHGGFRQIGEDALVQEIAAAKKGDGSVGGQSVEGNVPRVGDGADKGTKEYVLAKKAKMMHHLGYVYMCV